MAKFLKACLALFLGGFLILGIVMVVLNIQFDLPTQEAIAQPVWIPDGAEVRPYRVVSPGTFKISIPLEELQNTTQPDQPVLVVYSINRPESRDVLIDYYRSSQDGSGIFHYTRVVIPPPHKNLLFPNSLFTTWKASSFDEQNRAFQFTLVKDAFFLFMGIFLILMGGVGLSAMVGVELQGRKRKRIP